MEIHEMDVAVNDGHYVYQLGDLKIKTDSWERPGADSVLAIGGIRRGKVSMHMNYMLNHPEIVEGKRVFEPFAGAGPHGLLALMLGAKSCDLLDINPRAIQFMRDSARMSGLDRPRLRIIQGAMENFGTEAPYDIIFANPPFVPTPPSIAGVVHSNGGPDGCGPTRSLLTRLGQMLTPEGQAMIRSLQIEGRHGPILAGEIREASMGRPVEMMRTTDCYIDFGVLTRCLASEPGVRSESVEEWHQGLIDLHGDELTLNWYVIHVGARDAANHGVAVTDYDEARFGKAYGPGPTDHERRIQTLIELEIMR